MTFLLQHIYYQDKCVKLRFEFYDLQRDREKVRVITQIKKRLTNCIISSNGNLHPAQLFRIRQSIPILNPTQFLDQINLHHVPVFLHTRIGQQDLDDLFMSILQRVQECHEIGKRVDPWVCEKELDDFDVAVF